MQAVFRFKGAEEVVVSNQINGIMLEVYEGYATQCPACEARGAGAACVDDPKPGDVLKQKAILTFSKSEARAVASAMMGAAQQL